MRQQRVLRALVLLVSASTWSCSGSAGFASKAHLSTHDTAANDASTTTLPGNCAVRGDAQGASSPGPLHGLRSKTDWVERLLVEHPLVGTLYAPALRRTVTQAEFERAITEGYYILLGEKHDNRDHHLLERDILRRVTRLNPGRAVAFEMIDEELQPKVDASLGAHPFDVDLLAIAIDWEQSGWPSWPTYRPVFEAALEGEGAIVAANLSRKRIREKMQAAPAALAAEVGELPALAPQSYAQLEEDIRDAHCGMLSVPAVEKMVLMQRLRDRTLALRLLAQDRGDKAVLIAGAGHVRRDRGVPLSLAGSSDKKVLSVALVEVSRSSVDPAEYEGGPPEQPAFDYLLFTPRVDESDPCEGMRNPSK